MNDITKARYFLQTKGSKLTNLATFGSMLATAQENYKQVRLERVGVPGNKEETDPREVDALLDYSVLRYLKRHNRLPSDAAEALHESATLEKKRDLALKWMNT